MRSFLALIALFSILLSSAQEESKNEIVFHHDVPFDSLLAIAKAANKPLMVDGFTTWCGPCKMMSKNTFTDQEVADFFNENFINVKYNMEQPVGMQFGRNYPVTAYPTIYFINNDGEVMRIIQGYRDPSQFMKEADYALHPEKTALYQSTQEYNNGNRDPKFLKKHIENISEEHRKFNGEGDEYYKAIDDKNLMVKDNMMVFAIAIDDINHPWSKEFISKKDELVKKNGLNWYNQKTLNIIQGSLAGIVESADEAGLASLISLAKSGLEGSKRLPPENAVQQIEAIYYQQNPK